MLILLLCGGLLWALFMLMACYIFITEGMYGYLVIFVPLMLIGVLIAYVAYLTQRQKPKKNQKVEMIIDAMSSMKIPHYIVHIDDNEHSEEVEVAVRYLIEKGFIAYAKSWGRLGYEILIVPEELNKMSRKYGYHNMISAGCGVGYHSLDCISAQTVQHYYSEIRRRKLNPFDYGR